jgi:sporulation protein YlmC with PRC-barrel domain
MKKLVIAAALAAVSTSVLAQTATQPAPANRTTTTATTPAAATGQWRASKLIGLNVYNEQNEKLGDISEVLVDKSGKVAGLVIGVGGFLGMGQRDILVSMDKLKFVNEPRAAAANTGSGTAAQPANRSADAKWYPDHAVMAGATKDALKTMQEFKY